MKINLKVHPNSSREEIKKISETELEIWLKEKPIDGKANQKLLKLLKKYFGKNVEIVSGTNSRKKIIEV